MKYRFLSLAALLSCAAPSPQPAEQPEMTGVITLFNVSVLTTPAGDSLKSDSVFRMRVTDSTLARESCAQSTYFVFDESALLERRTGARAEYTDLRIGQRVTVWSNGYFLDSCSRQTSTTRIVLEDAP